MCYNKWSSPIRAFSKPLLLVEVKLQIKYVTKFTKRMFAHVQSLRLREARFTTGKTLEMLKPELIVNSGRADISSL